MVGEPYHRIVKHYEDCLTEHGEGAAAVDWRDEESAEIRYGVMLGVIRENLRDETSKVTLLDFGCGLGGLKDYIDQHGLNGISYSGLDLSSQFVEETRKRHPGLPVYCCDILEEGSELPDFDYIIMNGVFTRRQDLTVEEMKAYFERLSKHVFAKCRKGLAFNVMSNCVDWKSESLFHACHGELSHFVCKELSQHFILRNDYGLHETTCYVYGQSAHDSKVKR